MDIPSISTSSGKHELSQPKNVSCFGGRAYKQILAKDGVAKRIVLYVLHPGSSFVLRAGAGAATTLLRLTDRTCTLIDSMTRHVAIIEDALRPGNTIEHLIDKIQTATNGALQTLDNIVYYDPSPMTMEEKKAKASLFKIEVSQLFKEYAPNLQVDSRIIDERLEELLKIDCKIEEYTEQLKSNLHLIDLLRLINKKLPKDQEAAEGIKELVFDALVSTYLVPHRDRVVDLTRIQQQTIQSFSSQELNEFLGNIALPLERDELFTFKDLFPSQDPTILHVTTYSELSFSQKSILFSMSNMVEQVSKDLVLDPLFQQIWNSPYLDEWLLSATGSLPQEYLNTCVPTAIGQRLLNKVPTIVGLLHFSANLNQGIKEIAQQNSEKLKSQIAFQKYFGGGINSMKHLDKIIHEVDAQVKAIRQQAQALLDEEKNTRTRCSRRRQESLLQSWNISFQKLCSVLDPDNIVLLANEPVRGHWALSLLLETVVQFLSILKPGQIRMTELAWSGLPFDLEERTSKVFKYLFEKNIKISESCQEYQTSGDKKKYIEGVWKSINNSGGVVGELAFHVVFLRAVKLNNEPVFLLSDPMKNGYKILTFDQFESYIRSNFLRQIAIGNTM